MNRFNSCAFHRKKGIVYSFPSRTMLIQSTCSDFLPPGRLPETWVTLYPLSDNLFMTAWSSIVPPPAPGFLISLFQMKRIDGLRKKFPEEFGGISARLLDCRR